MKPAPRLACLLLAAALSLALSAPALCGHMSEATHSAPLAVGQAFPDVHLPGPLAPDVVRALGTGAASGGFRLHALRAPVVVLEVFSMYCPYCQAEAPTTVELARLIERRGLADRVKLLGVGAGNTQYEVDVFRDTYAVPFPLFPDPDYQIHKACGEVGTPFFYVLAKTPDGYVVRLVQEGQTDGAERFLGAIVKATGIR